MKISTFNQAAKEIILTALAALLLFASLAGLASANISEQNQVALSIENITKLEQSYLQQKQKLTATELRFDEGEESLEMVFAEALSLHDIEEKLVKARVELLIQLEPSLREDNRA